MLTTGENAGWGRNGVTLVELLVAMSILLIFGSLAVTTLMYGNRMLRTGHRRSYGYEVANTVFEQFDDDISAARSQFYTTQEDAFDTRVKFWVNRDEFYGIWQDDPGRQVIRFVRSIPDEAVNPRIRSAGDGVGNDNEWYNLKDDDGDGQVDEDLMALEGLCEVAYLLGLGNDGSGTVTDTRTLYRAVLAPIGHRDPDATTGDGGDTGADRYGVTFFNAVDSDDALGNSYRIDKKAAVLAEHILHFEVRLRTQYTTTWDLLDDDGDVIDFARWEVSWEPEFCRPLLNWDSDRLIPQSAGGNPPEAPDPAPSNPRFLMDPGAPGFAQDTENADGDDADNQRDPDYVDDNVFPRAVMLVIVVDSGEEYAARNRLRLASEIPDATSTDDIAATGQMPPFNSRWPYVLIEDEWIMLDPQNPYEGSGTSFTLNIADDGRGARGTEALGHPAGAELRFGQTLTRTFYNPAGRDLTF